MGQIDADRSSEVRKIGAAPDSNFRSSVVSDAWGLSGNVRQLNGLTDATAAADDFQLTNSNSDSTGLSKSDSTAANQKDSRANPGVLPDQSGATAREMAKIVDELNELEREVAAILQDLSNGNPHDGGAGTSTNPKDGDGGAWSNPKDGGGGTSSNPKDGGGGASSNPKDGGGGTSSSPKDGGGGAWSNPKDGGGGTSSSPKDGGGGASSNPKDGGGGTSTNPKDGGAGTSTNPKDAGGAAPSESLLSNVAAGAPGVTAEQVKNDKNLQQAFSYGAAPMDKSSNVVEVANQAQLDQLLQQNGNTLKNVTVELAGGAYNVNNTITLGGGATIESANPNDRATLNWMGGSNSEFWVQGDGNQASNLNVAGAGNYAFSLEHATNTTVSGVNIQDQAGKALTRDGFDIEASSHTTIAGTTTQEVEGYSVYVAGNSTDTLLYGDNFGIASPGHQGGSADQWNVRVYGANGFATVGSTINQPQLETPGSPIKGDLEILGGSETPGGTSNPAIIADSQILGTAKNQTLAPGQIGQQRGLLVGQLNGNSWIKDLTNVAEKVFGITDSAQAHAWAIANYPKTWSQAQADLSKYSQYIHRGDFHGELTADVNGQRFADAPASLVAQDEQSVNYRANVVADNNSIEGSIETVYGGTLTALNNRVSETVDGVGAFTTSTGGASAAFDSVPAPVLNLENNTVTVNGGGAQWLTDGGGTITGSGNTANGVAVNA